MEGQNLRGRNLMIKEVIGHCRRKGENRTVKIQSCKYHRILASGWLERRKSELVGNDEKKRQSWGLHSVPKGYSLLLSCCTAQQMLVFLLCSHRESGLWQPFQSYLEKQFYRISLETISQTNCHCEDCSIQIFSQFITPVIFVLAKRIL